MSRSLFYKILFITPVFILVSHYLSVFPHMYAHSFVAWMLGDKTNPLDLTYGGISFSNILFLSNIDENVNYQAILLSTHKWHLALIGFAGPGFANGLLFIISILLIRNKRLEDNPFTIYFLYWFTLMNLGNIYDVFLLRTFAGDDDVAHIVGGLHISRWWIYIVGGYIIAFLIWRFFSSTMLLTYFYVKIESLILRVMIVILTAVILFGFFSLAAYFDDDIICHFMSITSMALIPAVIAAAWPTRDWVRWKV